MNKEDQIIKDYGKRSPALTVDEITSKFKISNKELYKTLKKHNVPKRGRIKIPPKNPKHDLVGKRYHHLLVLRMEITDKSRDRSWRCICQCDCGNIADVSTNYLMRGLRKTCGKKGCNFHRQDKSNNGKKSVTFTGHEGIHGSKWSMIRLGAKRRKIKFDIDIKYAWNLYLEQKKKCSLSGRDISFAPTHSRFNETTASLDRIDSRKGYVKGNVQWVHKDVNKIKWELGQKYFIELCKEIVEFNT